MHLRVIRGHQYVTTYLAWSTPEENRVIALTRNIGIGKLPTTVETLPICLDIEEREVTSLEGPTRALVISLPGEAKLTLDIPTVEKVSMPSVSISPLLLVMVFPKERRGKENPKFT